MFLDEDVPKRLAGELRSRGRRAESIYAAELCGTLDEPLIRLLGGRYGSDVVLVTANESMPIEHRAVLEEIGLTVGVIAGDFPHDVHQDAWKRETVHRWAHVMATQRAATIRRYFPHVHRAWTRRRRRR